MRTPRRWVAGLLAGAALLAIGTPWFLARAQTGVAPYLLNAWIFIIQGLPYALAAALLVPGWSWGSDRAALIIAGLVLALALALYLPVLLAPQRWGGDMIALAFLAMSVGTVAVLLVASALVAVTSRLVQRYRNRN